MDTPDRDTELSDRINELQGQLDSLKELLTKADASPAPQPKEAHSPSGQVETPRLNPDVLPSGTLEALTPGLAGPPAAKKPAGLTTIDVDRLLKWSGVALVILAIGFFMSVAIERGWLTPELRVVGGIAVGAVLLAVGHQARPRQAAYGRTLQVGGIITLFVTLWAAHEVLGLIGFATTLGLMALVSAGGLALSALYADPSLAALASVGGLATPLILMIGGNSSADEAAAVLTLVAYSSVLLTVTTWLYIKHRWRSLLWAASAGGAVNVLVAGALAARTNDDPSRWVATLGVVFIVAVAWAIPVAIGESEDGWDSGFEVRLRPFLSTALHQLSILTPLWAWTLLSGIWSDVGEIPFGEFAALVGVIAAAISFSARDRQLRLTNATAALMMGFIAIADLFEDALLVLALAAYAVVIHYAADRLQSSVMRVAGHVSSLSLVVILFLRLVLTFGDPTWLDLIADLMAVGSFGVVALLVRRKQTRVIYAVLAYVGTHFWVVEMADRFDSSLAIVSVGWALIGLSMFVYGRSSDKTPYIQAGSATLVVVIGKLFLVDLAEVDPIAKIALFLGVGALFLGVSYFTKEDGTREDGPEETPGPLDPES